MRTLPLWLATLALAGLAYAPMPAQAAQSYDNCTGFIDTVPATITTQGTWCLRKDLSTAITSGAAIIINTNNVTIDCNDFKLGGLQAGVGTSAGGIFASERLNATVRHCNIRGFKHGIYLAGSNGGGHLVEDNRLDGNTYFGLYVAGDGSLVQRNRVNTTGGSTSNNGVAVGLYAVDGVDILYNSVDGVAPTANGGGFADAYGIYNFNNPSGSLIGNRVRGIAPVGPVSGQGQGYGIYNPFAGRITLERNHVVGPGRYAIYCGDPAGSARDNNLSGFQAGIQGCTDDGGNVIKL